MCCVLCLIFTKDKNIVQIDHDKFVQEINEHFIHEAHEGGRSVGQPKRHNCKLVEAIASGECSFWDISFVDADLIVARTQIDFGKHLCAAKAFQKVLSRRKWVLIPLSNIVETTIIDAKPEASSTRARIFLFLQKERGKTMESVKGEYAQLPAAAQYEL